MKAKIKDKKDQNMFITLDHIIKQSVSRNAQINSRKKYGLDSQFNAKGYD